VAQLVFDLSRAGRAERACGASIPPPPPTEFTVSAHRLCRVFFQGGSSTPLPAPPSLPGDIFLAFDVIKSPPPPPPAPSCSRTSVWQDKLENFQVMCSFGSFSSASSSRRPVASPVAWVAPDRDWRLPQMLSSPLLDLLDGFSLSFWPLFSELFDVARQRGQTRSTDTAPCVRSLIFESVPNLLGMHASSSILFFLIHSPVLRLPNPVNNATSSQLYMPTFRT